LSPCAPCNLTFSKLLLPPLVFSCNLFGSLASSFNSLHRPVLSYIHLYFLTSSCNFMNPLELSCSLLYFLASSCKSLHPLVFSCILLLFLASSCTSLHPLVISCISMYFLASSCTSCVLFVPSCVLCYTLIPYTVKNYSRPGRVWSMIPAGDGKNDNLFLQCISLPLDPL
jgi:hypothetical protein